MDTGSVCHSGTIPLLGLMPAVHAPAFAIPRPALDLIGMHGELEACSKNVDSASIDPACADSPFLALAQ
jgi:hypothetical protein